MVVPPGIQHALTDELGSERADVVPVSADADITILHA
jgi:hypothetical protein